MLMWPWAYGPGQMWPMETRAMGKLGAVGPIGLIRKIGPGPRRPMLLGSIFNQFNKFLMQFLMKFLIKFQ